MSETETKVPSDVSDFARNFANFLCTARLLLNVSLLPIFLLQKKEINVG